MPGLRTTPDESGLKPPSGGAVHSPGIYARAGSSGSPLKLLGSMPALRGSTAALHGTASALRESTAALHGRDPALHAPAAGLHGTASALGSTAAVLPHSTPALHDTAAALPAPPLSCPNCARNPLFESFQGRISAAAFPKTLPRRESAPFGLLNAGYPWIQETLPCLEEDFTDWARKRSKYRRNETIACAAGANGSDRDAEQKCRSFPAPFQSSGSDLPSPSFGKACAPGFPSGGGGRDVPGP
jgi:hypothetical protein